MGELHRVSLDDPAWAAFVAGHPDATPFHEPAWARMLAECYRLTAFALVERDPAGGVDAGLPLVAPPRIPGRPRRLVSLPYTDLVGPLVAPLHEASFAGSLDAARRRLGYDRVELRGAVDGADELATQAVIHTLGLGSDVDAMLANLTKGKRRDVRAAQRSGLSVRRAERETDVTQTYFDLHLRTRRRLGVPSQPRRFFALLWRQLLEPGHGFVLIAEQGGSPVAGAVFLTGNGTVVYKYSASDRAARGGLATDLLVWHAIADSCRQGFAVFDFGRSELDAHGLRRFKDRWGAVERPLVYSVVGLQELRPAPLRRGGSTAARVLRRAPLWLTRLSGEVLYRYAA
jgi:CelD/BcsL family acetyltransferase involved in cellulose biosynthesis